MLSFGTVPQPVINQDLYQTVCLGGNLGASDIGLPPALVGAGCAVALPRGPNSRVVGIHQVHPLVAAHASSSRRSKSVHSSALSTSGGSVRPQAAAATSSSS